MQNCLHGFLRKQGISASNCCFKVHVYAELVKPVQVEPEGKEYDDVHVRAEETRVELEVSKDAQDHSGKRGLALLERERLILHVSRLLPWGRLMEPGNPRMPPGISYLVYRLQGDLGRKCARNRENVHQLGLIFDLSSIVQIPRHTLWKDRNEPVKARGGGGDTERVRRRRRVVSECVLRAVFRGQF